MDILQSDNGSEFKGVYFALASNFGAHVINGRPQTPRTQGLVEQSNGTAKTRINAWKRTHGLPHWSECSDEVALQMNSTYHRAVKATPYEVVFNRKPRFESLDIANRHLTEADIEECVINDDQDDVLVAEDREGQQLRKRGEPLVRQSRGIFGEEEDSTESEEDETSQEEEESEEDNNYEPTIETEDELLPEDPTDLDAINAYFARINMPDSDADESDNDLSDPPPSTPPSHPLDNNLQALSPQMQSLKLNPESLREVAESSSTFRAHIHANQLHANERSIRQYGKKRSVKVFAIGDKVSVAVPALDRASTDDKRVFGQVIKSFGDAYSIQTKHRVLERNHPTSELMPLLDTIKLGIPEPPPSKKITLHTVAAKTEKVPVRCKCKDELT